MNVRTVSKGSPSRTAIAPADTAREGQFLPSVGSPLFGHHARMTLYTGPDLVGLFRKTLKRTHPDRSTMEITALFWLVSQTRRHSPTTSIDEPWIEAPIIELEATTRAAEPRSRAIPGQSRGEAREALTASERTQSNEGQRRLETTRGARPGAPAAPGRPRPGIPLSPVLPTPSPCRRSSTAPLHRLL